MRPSLKSVAAKFTASGRLPGKSGSVSAAQRNVTESALWLAYTSSPDCAPPSVARSIQSGAMPLVEASEAKSVHAAKLGSSKLSNPLLCTQTCVYFLSKNGKGKGSG